MCRRPKVTRALGPRYRTARQRRADYRDLVIAAAFRQGCSVRLIAEAFDLDPARVRAILDHARAIALSGSGEKPPP